MYLAVISCSIITSYVESNPTHSHDNWTTQLFQAHLGIYDYVYLFSSAVPSGSGAFQMPTRPSAAAGGGGAISETLQ